MNADLIKENNVLRFKTEEMDEEIKKADSNFYKTRKALKEC